MVVAYSVHAVQRLCERCVGDPYSYLGAGDAHGLIRDGVVYERWRDGFVVWDKCVPGFWSGAYSTEITGQEVVTSNECIYRVGYAVCEPHERLLKAKTILSPGMDNTPEAEWYLANVNGNRNELRKRASKLRKKDLCESEDFSLLREFHEGGLEQVRRT
jgi:hypothetical protein